MATKPTGKQIVGRAVSFALKDVGYREGKRNANKFAAMVGAPNNAPYCAIGVHSAYARACSNTASLFRTPWFVPGIYADAKRKGWLMSAPVRDGDYVIFDWQGDRSDGDHIGIALPSRGRYVSVEYNTSPSNAGSQGDGGGVFIRHRNPRQIIGYIDARKMVEALGYTWDVEILRKPKVRRGDRGPGVAEVQKRLGITVDGVYGPITDKAVRDYQRRKGLAVDGVVGAATWSAMIGRPVRVDS